MSSHVLSGWALTDSPFHAGEQALQQQLGVREKMERAGRHGIRHGMPDQHRDFFPQLPFIVVGSIDGDGQPWASLLCNPPGFIQSPDATHLVIHAQPDPFDPLYELLTKDSLIGLLGIQPHTRRRNRLNGRIVEQEADSLVVEALQSFGNCPKYIQARLCEYEAHESPSQPVVVTDNKLNDAMKYVIRESDMFFIATAHPDASNSNVTNQSLAPQHGVDVSHRGGKPGFVHINDDVLIVPDYVGNFFFNTLGNLLLNPRAGLVFIEFTQGSLLHLSVEGAIVSDEVSVRQFSGAQRLLRFTIKEARHVYRRLPLRWTGWELSPHLIDK